MIPMYLDPDMRHEGMVLDEKQHKDMVPIFIVYMPELLFTCPNYTKYLL